MGTTLNGPEIRALVVYTRERADQFKTAHSKYNAPVPGVAVGSETASFQLEPVLEAGLQDAAVDTQGEAIAGGDVLDELGRPFDVGEDEGETTPGSLDPYHAAATLPGSLTARMARIDGAQATADVVVEALAQDGYCIVERLISADDVAAARSSLIDGTCPATRPARCAKSQMSTPRRRYRRYRWRSRTPPRAAGRH